MPTDTPDLFRGAVVRAASLLRAGEVVAVPTETVIVHVADEEMAKRCVSNWPPAARKLAAAFWPGPLTLVLPRASIIPENVTAGGHTVGVRWPSHPFIQALIRECGFPLAAPSANPSNRISPTNAEHVRKALGNRVPLIIDGGQSQVGIESTVLDLSASPPRVLRPGMIHDQALLSVTGSLAGPGESGSKVLKSPGLLRKHYAPRAHLVLRSWADDEALRKIASESGVPEDAIYLIAHTRIPSPGNFASVSVIPHDPEAFARAIYAELHRCDEAGAELILVEALPESVEWQAIADRLLRAAA